MSTLRVLLAEAPGAVLGELAGSEVVRHFGDPSGEYDALRRSAVVVHRSDLAQIRIYGKDPVRMLNGLITNDLALMEGGRAVYAAMLTPKGRMISDLRALRYGPDEAEVLLDVPAVAESPVLDHLKKYVPPMFARSESISGRVVVIGVYGPAAVGIVGAVVGVEVDPGEDRVTRGERGENAWTAVGTAITAGPGVDIFVEAEAAPDLWRALVAAAATGGGVPAGFAALETARIEAGRGRFGIDINEETLPGEAYESTNQLPRAVSFTKGCYTGQEVVIRIAHRGHVNRHLRGLRVGDSPALPSRMALFLETGKEVGWLSSSAHSPRYGEMIGLGTLRREVEIGGVVRVGSPEGPVAEVVEIPFT